jgi:hypothetical protein
MGHGGEPFWNKEKRYFGIQLYNGIIPWEIDSDTLIQMMNDELIEIQKFSKDHMFDDAENIIKEYPKLIEWVYHYIHDDLEDGCQKLGWTSDEEGFENFWDGNVEADKLVIHALELFFEMPYEAKFASTH